MRLALIILALTAALPSPATAQRPSGATAGGRLTVEPFAGVLRDAYDVGDDGSRLGPVLGARLGYGVARAVRVTAALGYARVGDVGYHTGTDYFIARNDWLLASAGGEVDVLPPGPTSVALGLEGGMGWRRIAPEGQVGAPVGPPESGGDWSPVEALVPSVTVRRRVGARAAVALAMRDYMFDVLEDGSDHTLVLTVGLTLR